MICWIQVLVRHLCCRSLTIEANDLNFSGPSAVNSIDDEAGSKTNTLYQSQLYISRVDWAKFKHVALPPANGLALRSVNLVLECEGFVLGKKYLRTGWRFKAFNRVFQHVLEGQGWYVVRREWYSLNAWQAWQRCDDLYRCVAKFEVAWAL